MLHTTTRRDRSLAQPTARLDGHRPTQLQAWREARTHLLAADLWPIVPADVERALRSRRWWQ